MLASGCGDLIANIIAVKDWQLGHKKKKEYYGRYAADLAMMSAKIVMENSSEFAKKGLDARVIVEGIISAGVASCIAGSSRPCSGAEHLFSHALDKIGTKDWTSWRKMWNWIYNDGKITRARLEKNCKNIKKM